MQLRALAIGLVFAAYAHAAWAAPDWVASSGKSARHPRATHLTGFGMGEGPRGMEQAKLQAVADLAKQITVRIDQASRETTSEKDGKLRYETAVATSASTDVRLSNVAYLTHVEGKDSFALAFVERARVAGDRRAQRDRALTELRGCVASAQKAEATPAALASYLDCTRSVPAALEHESIARAVSGATAADDSAQNELIELRQRALDRITALSQRAAATPAGALGTVAFTLAGQGVHGRLSFAPLTYGTTQYSSALGRQLALDLERALAAQAARDQRPDRDLVVRGAYLEAGPDIRLLVTARETESGKLVAGAEASFPRSALPKELSIQPQNFAGAMVQEKLLGEGEEVSGDLKVELWANKGDRHLVYSQGEELKIWIRVNRAAYVRLIYLTADGARIPLDQAYFIDESKRNRAVEYPDAFEIAAPFGIEQIYAVAFTDKPDPLPTTKQTIGGEEQQVIAELAALVKHRGVKRKAKSEVAEARLALTTTP
mgnify:CR=1 FL=1